MSEASGHEETRSERVRHLVEREEYWFHRIELPQGVVTPGWSDPREEKLPHYRLPEDLSGMRVLDIGCAEGFFSFECERRGAAEVVAIDSFPDSVRRFNVCRDALDSRATAYLTNVYDLSPEGFGTFDLVLFYGVLYHLRHPILALQKIASVASGELRLQSANFEHEAFANEPLARFHPFGRASGTEDNPMFDPTVFWVPNAACIAEMLAHVGFVDIDGGSTETVGAVFSARVPEPTRGTPPDQTKAPWC